VNLNRWEWSNSAGRLRAIPRSGSRPKEKYWDPVTNTVYDADSTESRFHLLVYNVLDKECSERNPHKTPHCEPPIREWLEAAYRVMHDSIKEIALKHRLQVPAIEQVKEVVGEPIKKRYGKEYYENNYETCKVWAIRVSKLLDPNSSHKADISSSCY
jgi:hypothetical protein